MEIRLAKTAGFCYGVERAVRAVYDEIDKGAGRIYTYGPIVHNETVVEELKNKGVEVIEDFDVLKEMAASGKISGSTVVIRAHGVGRDVTELLNDPAYRIHVVDATCPFVKKIHNIVTEHYKAEERIIVTGTYAHPEVQGILGQIGFDADVIENTDEAAEYSPKTNQKVCVVSQTTFNTHKFQDIVAILKEKLYDVNIVDTICNATQLRQKEALSLSRECDAMIVIGGRHSSNTTKLYDICCKECSATYFIESAKELSDQFHGSVRCVGITAGASTPKTIIQEVLKYVRDEF